MCVLLAFSIFLVTKSEVWHLIVPYFLCVGDGLVKYKRVCTFFSLAFIYSMHGELCVFATVIKFFDYGPFRGLCCKRAFPSPHLFCWTSRGFNLPFSHSSTFQMQPQYHSIQRTSFFRFDSRLDPISLSLEFLEDN